MLDDQPEWINEIIRSVRPYTMTGPERIAALCQAVAYVNRAKIRGDIVECGVWRGGSMMAAALSNMRLDERRDRALWLYDTFSGMTQPTEADVDLMGRRARDAVLVDENVRAYATLAEVKRNLESTGYPQNMMRCVIGRVEDTIPVQSPASIALLRLDTDWYESTRHELEHLWPRLSSGGICIIDDYGHWQGARRAVDEFVEQSKTPLFLSRIDYTGRLIVKP